MGGNFLILNWLLQLTIFHKFKGLHDHIESFHFCNYQCQQKLVLLQKLVLSHSILAHHFQGKGTINSIPNLSCRWRSAFFEEIESVCFQAYDKFNFCYLQLDQVWSINLMQNFFVRQVIHPDISLFLSACLILNRLCCYSVFHY